MGSQRVGHDWATNTHTHTLFEMLPTPRLPYAQKFCFHLPYYSHQEPGVTLTPFFPINHQVLPHVPSKSLSNLFAYSISALLLPKTKPVVLTRKWSGPARDVWNCLETAMVVTTWRGEAASAKWAGATDGAQHLTGRTTVPPTKEWSGLSHQ